MTNHPNRGWRRRMHEACTAYLGRWTWRAGGVRILSDNQLREQLEHAYRAGYTDRHRREYAPTGSP